jgi:hypothetical protein
MTTMKWSRWQADFSASSNMGGTRSSLRPSHDLRRVDVDASLGRDGAASGLMFGTCISPSSVIAAKAAIQYAATERFLRCCLWHTGSPGGAARHVAERLLLLEDAERSIEAA